MRKPGILLLAVLALAASVHAADRACSAQDATKADALVDQLDSWSKLESAVKQFGHCDAGSIAEGNSEAVARLLVDHWNTVPQLVYLAQQHPELRRFVLKHVDSTLDTADLERVAWLAAHACPSGATGMCNALSQAATAALDAQAR